MTRTGRGSGCTDFGREAVICTSRRRSLVVMVRVRAGKAESRPGHQTSVRSEATQRGRVASEVVVAVACAR
jgi:hypothetical protein